MLHEETAKKKWERKRDGGKKENARKEKKKIVSQRILRRIPLKEKKILQSALRYKLGQPLARANNDVESLLRIV